MRHKSSCQLLVNIHRPRSEIMHARVYMPFAFKGLIMHAATPGFSVDKLLEINKIRQAYNSRRIKKYKKVAVAFIVTSHTH